MNRNRDISTLGSRAHLRLLAMLFVLVSTSVSAQHVALQSHYMFNGVELNPAYTGSDDAFTLIGSHRSQWTGFDGAPSTQSFTAHAPLRSMKSALGVQFYADQIGADHETGIYGSYAYRLKLTETSTLALGLAGGVSFFKGNYGRLQVNDSGDDLLNDTELFVYPDVSFGLHYYTEKAFVSFSVPRFLSHKIEGTGLKLTNDIKNYNFLFGGGYVFEVNPTMNLKPSVLTKLRYGSKVQVDLNLMAALNKSFDVGVSYRTKEAVVGLFKFSVNNQFSVMYSFGMPLNALTAYTYGSHELSLKYAFIYKTKVSSPRFLGW